MLGTGLVPNPCGTRSILVTVGGGIIASTCADELVCGHGDGDWNSDVVFAGELMCQVG